MLALYLVTHNKSLKFAPAGPDCLTRRFALGKAAA